MDTTFLLNTGKGGQEVVVELNASREDEPLGLAAKGHIAAETVDVADVVDVETGGNAEVVAVLVVFADIAEFDGEHHGVEGVGDLFAIEIVEGEAFDFIG